MTTPKGPQLAVLPTAADDDTRSRVQVLQPSGWPMPKGYANGMAAEGLIVVTGGGIGWDAEGRLADGFMWQRGPALGHIGAILAGGGAEPGPPPTGSQGAPPPAPGWGGVSGAKGA